MKGFHKLIGIVLSLTMITLISGCGGSSSSTPSANVETGILSLSITDAPMSKKLDGKVATEVNIAVIGIEYHLSDGEWADVNDFKDNNFVPQTFNLLDLKDGNSLPLGDFELPAGHYTQIRFMLAIPKNEGEVKSNPDCNITLVEGGVSETKPLFVPSGGQSGYKGIGEFYITKDANVSITADWDASRSIVVAGDKYILKPVIRLVVTELTGWINGTVLNVADYNATDSLVVYAYKENIYDEVGEPEDFLKAVTSGEVNMSEGNFTLAFLGAGFYDLVTAYYDDGNYAGVADVEYDVEVFKAEGTPVELTITKPTP
ncbi:DUF4382 domain-containing protein [Sulfurovum sp. CS9]|uniref:DUF4382 domain-containing protein n=1 Tax=Sulfurovum sp. CS9 TaxID=3391146 RepID=UPI0039EBC14B